MNPSAGDGWTRLVSSTTYRSRNGSIHSDVPVNPVWPNAPGDSRRAARRGRAHQVPAERARAAGDAAGREHASHQPRRAEPRRPSQRFEDESRVRAHRARRAEEAGMPRHAVEGPRVLVVNLTDEQPSAPGAIVLRRRRAHTLVRRWPEEQIRARQIVGELVVHPAAVDRLEDQPEQDEPEVAVDRSRARRVLERHGGDLVREVRSRPARRR